MSSAQQTTNTSVAVAFLAHLSAVAARLVSSSAAVPATLVRHCRSLSVQPYRAIAQWSPSPGRPPSAGCCCCLPAAAPQLRMSASSRFRRAPCSRRASTTCRRRSPWINASRAPAGRRTLIHVSLSHVYRMHTWGHSIADTAMARQRNWARGREYLLSEQ